ncbi:magnesium transporter [Planobispora siamensis]|uniref:Magnesium transporter n=1 Tax=Planobispora siamensis TaxID=936338 RepID=A0A8J3WP47_9ACTN|nr:magnesium transporter [Planobispora siamensis]GIH95222.1 magnesium transporter [Planobispora siamensis]
MTIPRTAAQPGEFTGTAGEHTVTAVPVFDPSATAREAWTRMLGTRFDSASDIVVRDAGGRLYGLVSVERLLAAAPAATLADLADRDPPIVTPGTDQEIAAWHAVRHGESGLAVVDPSGRFTGLVPRRRLLRVLLQEHDEDMARLGGYLKGSATARTAAEESVTRRFAHRMPWLLLGLAGAMASAGIVGSFEDRLAANVALAFFLPGVIYMADAVGTQTEAVVVRALSVGVSIRRLARGESATGLIIGLAMALAFLPFALLYGGDAQVALTAVISLFAACSVASALAMVLPWLLNRLGRDPAFGSGPLATVIQDLLSITVYLFTATLIVG